LLLQITLDLKDLEEEEVGVGVAMEEAGLAVADGVDVVTGESATGGVETVCDGVLAEGHIMMETIMPGEGALEATPDGCPGGIGCILNLPNQLCNITQHIFIRIRIIPIKLYK
jgi:hypothetical protein